MDDNQSILNVQTLWEKVILTLIPALTIISITGGISAYYKAHQNESKIKKLENVQERLAVLETKIDIILKHVEISKEGSKSGKLDIHPSSDSSFMYSDSAVQVGRSREDNRRCPHDRGPFTPRSMGDDSAILDKRKKVLRRTKPNDS